MKTRRIHLQPGECAEVVNQYGTSLLKVTARFNHAEACAVIYEQPGAFIVTAEESKEVQLTTNPISIQIPITKQDSLL